MDNNGKNPEMLVGLPQEFVSWLFDQATANLAHSVYRADNPSYWGMAEPRQMLYRRELKSLVIWELHLISKMAFGDYDMFTNLLQAASIEFATLRFVAVGNDESEREGMRTFLDCMSNVTGLPPSTDELFALLNRDKTL